MEETDLNAAAFWEEDTASVLLQNPALPDAGDVSSEVRRFLASERGLKGHAVFRTSGTGGEPKFVCLSKRALLASAESVNRHLGVERSDCWLRALPLFHVGGFGIHARAFQAGCRIEAMEGKWDAEKFAATCRREAVTFSSLVPAQVVDLVRGGHRAPDFLRVVVVGGGALREETGNRARDLGWPVVQSYGMTEAGSQVATARMGTGVFSGAKLPVLDLWETRCDGEGRLMLRGQALLSAYLDVQADRVECRDPRTPDGWFVTGDRVDLEQGADGGVTLTFRAREGDVVKILGELVSLGELRSKLKDLAGLRGLAGEVRLQALPDERRGARLVLECSERIPVPEAERLRDAMNAEAPGYARVEIGPRKLGGKGEHS